MAVSQGAGPHRATISVNGATFPIEHGRVTLRAGAGSNSLFSVSLPMSLPGAYETFANLGDNTAEIWCESHGLSDILIRGPVLEVTFDFINRNINPSGQDMGQKLQNEKTSEKFSNKTGSDIVQELAGRAGLSVQADAGMLMQGKKIVQDFVKLTDNISYQTAVHLVAQLDGARWFVDKRGTLHYQSLSNNSQGSYTIHYKPPSAASPMVCDAMQLMVHMNVEACKGVSCEVHSWHPKDKKLYIGKSQISGRGKFVKYLHRIPALDQAHAQQYADSKVKEYAQHALQLRAHCVGDPTIDVTMRLQLTGTGAFDQAYQIEEIDHDFGYGGHTMTITAKSPIGSGGGSYPQNWFWNPNM